jgi:hypothetical protein
VTPHAVAAVATRAAAAGEGGVLAIPAASS